MSEKLKNYVRWQLLKLTDWLSTPLFRVHVPSGVAIVRLDEIGDYILFRNFIAILKYSKKYSNCPVLLVGNIQWKELAKTLDQTHVERFVWIDKKKFAKPSIYRYCKLRSIKRLSYRTAINPMYSRDCCHLGDLIMGKIGAETKIGFACFSSIPELDDAVYTRLIQPASTVQFEFNRNIAFFEQLLEAPVCITRPDIVGYRGVSKIPLPKQYALLFIGASHHARMWAIENFAAVARFLRENYKLDIVLCGGRAERKRADLFVQQYGGVVKDLVGKTRLTDMIPLLRGASIIVSNETFLPHMAVACGCNYIFVVSNGNHFGRFTPYPKEMSVGYYGIYPQDIAHNLNDQYALAEKYGRSSPFHVDDVTAARVMNRIDHICKDAFCAK